MYGHPSKHNEGDFIVKYYGCKCFGRYVCKMWKHNSCELFDIMPSYLDM